MADRYEYFRVAGAEPDGGGAVERIAALQTRWASAGVACWGVWQGLFGIPSNEVLLVAAAARGPVDIQPLVRQTLAQAALQVVDRLALQATVRPERVEPLPDAGLYVFRFFTVVPEHVDEVVALSARAWQTFELSGRYQSRPLGLFRPSPPTEPTQRMLLVTWYDGFASWEASRAPAPEARENFQRRRALTRGTVAFAARRV